MIEFRKKTDLSGYVPYTGATAEVVLGQDLTLGDDKKLYFDTAKTQSIRYSSIVQSLISPSGYSIATEGQLGFYANANADGQGNLEPYMEFCEDGSVYLANTTQGNNKCFEIRMPDGLKLGTSGYLAIIKSDNLATANKTFQFPNISGTIGTVITKTNTGDPTGVEGVFCINTFDNNFKVYADGAWRTLSTW